VIIYHAANIFAMQGREIDNRLRLVKREAVLRFLRSLQT